MRWQNAWHSESSLPEFNYKNIRDIFKEICISCRLDMQVFILLVLIDVSIGFAFYTQRVIIIMIKLQDIR
jgi:hypothetical protein